jgi:hypothetical protein
MASMKYGTPEHYKEQFMDFVADAQADQPEYGEAIIKGFLLALEDWMQYHTQQATHYGNLQERVRSALGVS